MKITRISIYPQDKIKHIEAFCSVTLDDCFVVHGIKIEKRDDREKFIIQFPNKLDSKGDFKDICHPIDKDLRNYMEDEIIDKFHRVIQD